MNDENPTIITSSSTLLLFWTSGSALQRSSWTSPGGWKLKAANWSLFGELCSGLSDLRVDDPTQAYKQFVSIVLNAAGGSIPISRPPIGRPPVPWWDTTCRKLRDTARSCYRRFRRLPTEANKMVYQKAVANKRKYMKEAKRMSWQNYVSTIKTSTPSASVWNRVKKLSGRYIPSPQPSLLINDTVVSDPCEVAEEFATRHTLLPYFQLCCPTSRTPATRSRDEF
ncbi:uncharacterized protein LOC143039755 [Oratosquilla oratoria]|uniref:uncharacterized protein LOC143039755 n=1 Tax=Oratosquilla oratoria TaxID=337810 RepID=UPI003F7620C0